MWEYELAKPVNSMFNLNNGTVMSQNRIKLASLLILGVLIGCSGDSAPPNQQILVTNNEATNGDGINANNTDTGGDAGADAGIPNGDTGDAGETTAATTEAGATAGNTDAGTDTTDGTDTDGGTTTPGPAVYPAGSLAFELSNIAGLTTAFFALQAANLDEAIDDPENSFTLFLPINEAFVDLASPSDFVLERHKAAPAVLSGELVNYNGRALNMDDGSALIVEGDTARTLTIAGANVLRSDVVGTNGSTSVVHIIDTVIPEPTVSPYPPGSLTDVLFQRGDMTNALAAIRAAWLVGVLNDSNNAWTMFLPTDSVLTDPDDLNTQVHLYLKSAASSEDLVGLVGTRIRTNGGHTFLIGGGGTDPLTIGNVEIVEADLQSENESGTVVHIIDGLMMPDCCDPDKQ